MNYQPVKPDISDELRVRCEDLPKLQTEVGKDMKVSLLQNRAESYLVNRNCIQKHTRLLEAYGIEPIDLAPINRWVEFENKLKE